MISIYSSPIILSGMQFGRKIIKVWATKNEPASRIEAFKAYVQSLNSKRPVKARAYVLDDDEPMPEIETRFLTK